MSHHHFVDGIDIKIAEKYKVPPRISIPQDAVQRLQSGWTSSVSEVYDFGLERNVIQKIDEWKRAHDQQECERDEMLRTKDLERRKRIELEQKQMLTQISYPNADELSSTSSSDDESDDKNLKEKATLSSGVQLERSVIVRPLPNSFSTILMPTIVPESNNHQVGNGKLDNTSNSTSCSSNSVNGNPNLQNCPRNNSSSNSSQTLATPINYSDFENDNYSPFDRMELKSINDLDILAQVLQKTHVNQSVNQNGVEAVSSESESVNTSSTETSADAKPVVDHPPTTTAATTVNNNINNNAQQQAAEPQSTFGSVAVADNYSVWTQSGQQQSYVPFQPSYFSNMNYISHHQPSSYQYPMTTAVGGGANNRVASYAMHISPSPEVNNYQDVDNNNSATSYYYNQTHSTANTVEQFGTPPIAGSGSLSLARLRSKSVPDIVNELDEEVRASERKRRIRNNSQSADKCNKEKMAATGGSSSDIVKGQEEDCAALAALPPDSKLLAAKIAKMGFPIDVVATVIQQLGNDDKKIIEHLIPLSELLDLGFGVAPTSEALLKFNNNRERALDFLIS